MSISSETNFVSYTGDGATSVYSHPFVVASKNHLRVIVRDDEDVETVLTVDTDYTVNNISTSSGTITLVDADQDWINTSGYLTSGFKLVIRIYPPMKQESTFRNQGSYAASTHEDTFDRDTQKTQRLAFELARAIKQPESESALAMTLPLVADRASKFLAFDASGLPIASDGGIDGALPVSSYIEGLLDDADAATARTTLDVSRAISNLTEETAPVVGDYLPFYDISATADRKSKLGALLGAMLKPGQSINLGLANATTTDSNDSIKIQGASAALSSTNPLWVNVPHQSTAGLAAVLSATANVTIKLTGAHWGMGTLGDFTDVILRVYAINDAGTLKWGVSNRGGYRTITTALSSATQTDINLKTEMLVNSTLTGTSPCVEVGWFLADFDDTGGASEDLWTVQTALGEIAVGVPAPAYGTWTDYTPTIAGAGTVTVDMAQYKRNGDTLKLRGKITSGTVTADALTVTLPTGLLADTSVDIILAGNMGTSWNGGSIAGMFPILLNASKTLVQFGKNNTASQITPILGNAVLANGSIFWFTAEVPIVGWSGN